MPSARMGLVASGILAPGRLPHDMDYLKQADRKRTCFRSVLPHVLAANRQVRAYRAELKAVGGLEG